ncbi:fibroblast growth factor-binding protein 2-like [Myxocyprinus asiaticus]|uniref:fibroblast growth factor-binding protein 2-like n=1 Tax=Myxocyprinus asiaticus TaxID=70543 RepID=UPI002222F7C9|nr:fibroblast growth factor-binding protein 2-like [Myxocyprinus asiaticus]
MWKITVTFLLTCCLLAAIVQTQGRVDAAVHRRSVWEDPIQFVTKGTKDECYISVTGQGDMTNLRISCHRQEHSYWCEYQGKPQVCRSYNNNPQHYFKQIMWDLRKLPNACQGQRIVKPLMCKRASDEAQMVFRISSSPDIFPKDGPSRPASARPEQAKPQQSRREQRPKPTKPLQTQLQALRVQSARTTQDKPDQPKAVKSTTQRKMLTPKPTESKPTHSVPLSESKKLAQDYCWRSFQGVCSFFIGWFKN